MYVKFAGGWVKILSEEHYINIEDNGRKIEEQTRWAKNVVPLFLQNGTICTEREFNQAFAIAIKYFQNILSRITQQKFIAATEPASDCRDEVPGEVYDRNFELQESLNELM